MFPKIKRCNKMHIMILQDHGDSGDEVQYDEIIIIIIIIATIKVLAPVLNPLMEYIILLIS